MPFAEAQFTAAVKYWASGFFLYGTRFAPGERADDELQSQVSALSEKAATL